MSKLQKFITTISGKFCNNFTLLASSLKYCSFPFVIIEKMTPNDKIWSWCMQRGRMYVYTWFY